MSQVTLGSTTILNWQHGGSTCELRIQANDTFLPLNGSLVLRSYTSDATFYKSVTCSVSGTTITVPSMVLDCTTDSNVTNATYNGILYDENGERRQAYFSSYRIPTVFGLTPSWNQIHAYNSITPSPLQLNYPTIEQVEAIISADFATKQDLLVSGTNIKTVNTQSLLGSGNITVSGGDGSALLSDYANLGAAITAIGSTPKTLVISSDTTLTANLTVPSTLKIRTVNGAKIAKGSYTITFQGIGLEDPLSQTPIFSGFSSGNIQWSGTDYPSTLSSSLWADSVLSTRLNNAIAALPSKQSTILGFPGDIAAQVTVTAGHNVYLTRGTYTSSATGAENTQFDLASNTRLYGDGQGQTFLTENAASVTLVRASGASGAASGYNENIIVEHLHFLGNVSTPVDSVHAAVFLGNVTNGFVRYCTFDRTHGYAAYVGGDSATNGYLAQNVYLTDNICIGLQTQYMGTVGGRNVHISRNLFKISPGTGTPAFISVIDVEPNANSDGSDGLHITNNIFDGRLGDSGWNAITVQQGFSCAVRNVIVSNNLIIGMNNSVVTYSSADVSVATDTITAYSHGYETGQLIEMRKDDGGSGGALPGGFTGTDYFGYIIRTGINTVKIADTYAHSLAGTAVDITSQGSGIYLLKPGRMLSNGIQIWTVDSATVENNTIIGAAQYGIDVQDGYGHSIRNNKTFGCGSGAIRIINGSNCDIDNNTLLASPQLLTDTPTILEEDTVTLTVTTVSGSPTATTTSLKTLPWWYRNQTITINAVDYVIQARTGTTLTLVPNAATNGTYTGTLKTASNRYRGNKCSSVTLATGGSSFVYSDASDLRKKGTLTINPASVAANTVADQTFTLTGALVGDSVILSPPTAGLTAGLIFHQAWVSATDTVKVRFENTTGGAIDEASGTWYYTLFR